MRDEASSPLNNQIKNNLKSTNLEKQKMTYGIDEDDDDFLKGRLSEVTMSN